MFTVIEATLFLIGGLSSYIVWRREGGRFYLYCIWLCCGVLAYLIAEYLGSNVLGMPAWLQPYNAIFVRAFWPIVGVVWVLLIIFSGKKKSLPR